MRHIKRKNVESACNRCHWYAPSLIQGSKLVLSYQSSPGSQKVASSKGKDLKTVTSGRKRDFIKSHLGYVTKSDQYTAMKSFETNIMNLPDASEKGLFTGDRIVRKLRHRLKKVTNAPSLFDLTHFRVVAFPTNIEYCFHSKLGYHKRVS